MSIVTSWRPRRGRNVELLLLCLAVAIVTIAYVSVEGATRGSIPANLGAQAGGLLAIAVAIHLVLRFTASYADPLLLPIATLLNGLGLVMIHRLDIAQGRSLTEGMALRQLTWSALAVGIAIAVLLWLRDHRTLRRYTFLAGAAGVALLLLPLLPFIGREVNGARIWISGLGAAKVSGPVALTSSPSESVALAPSRPRGGFAMLSAVSTDCRCPPAESPRIGALVHPASTVRARATARLKILVATWITPSILLLGGGIPALRPQALCLFAHLPPALFNAFCQVRFRRVAGLGWSNLSAANGRLCRCARCWRRLGRTGSRVQLDFRRLIAGIAELCQARLQINQGPARLIALQWHSDLERNGFVPQIVTHHGDPELTGRLRLAHQDHPGQGGIQGRRRWRLSRQVAVSHGSRFAVFVEQGTGFNVAEARSRGHAERFAVNVAQQLGRAGRIRWQPAVAATVASQLNKGSQHQRATDAGEAKGQVAGMTDFHQGAFFPGWRR